jgi:lipid-A-disaccharide synthase
MTPLRIALIAGEPSGDLLGSKLMRALTAQTDRPIEFYGVGGERMQEHGLASLFPMAELSLIGFAEIIPHIPHLLRRIRQTVTEIERTKPDIVITIDAPEFCFRVAKKLQGSGLPLVHYVAPSVWAYREHRAAAIAKLYQHLLVLLPFEPPYFEKHGLQCSFIGHSIIEDAASGGDASQFRAAHQLDETAPLLCVLPGSRNSEVTRLWPIFAEAIILLAEKFPGLTVAIPAVSHLAEQLQEKAAALPVRAIVITDKEEKRHALAASTVALAKSGTGTLELAIAGLPMIVAYTVKPFSAWLLRRMIKVKYVTLINLILGREVIPEYLQERCTPPLLAEALAQLLRSPEQRALQQQESLDALKQLGYGSSASPSEKAALAVLGVIAAKQ